MSQQDYFNRVYMTARDAGATHVQSSIAAAQSAIETGWGRTVKGNAYFGIKAGPSWDGAVINFTTHEMLNGKRVKMEDGFRAYGSYEDSVKDYLAIIKAKWPDCYYADTIVSAAHGLDTGVHGKYATAPNYSRDVRLTAIKRAWIARDTYENGKATSVEAEAKANPKSHILPLYRPKQSDSVTLAVLDKYKHLIPADGRRDAVRLLFVRGYFLNSMGKKNKNDRALYDDAVFVVSPDGVQSFNANSDPAVFRHRVATIKANQAIRYRYKNAKGEAVRHGISKGPGYPAFRQDAPCTVVRDGIGDDTGLFAVNLHRGGKNGTSSLGCLTIPPHQWNEFYGLIAGLMDKYGQKTFYVTLLEYGGNNPPVTKMQALPRPKPVKPSAAPAAVAVVSIGALIASWWGDIWQWIAGLFS